jgi:hypothetical protein
MSWYCVKGCGRKGWRWEATNSFPLPILQKVWRTVMTKQFEKRWSEHLQTDRLKNDTEICLKNYTIWIFAWRTTRCEYLSEELHGVNIWNRFTWLGKGLIDGQITKHMCARVIPLPFRETWHTHTHTRARARQPQGTNRKFILSIRSLFVLRFTLTSDDVFINLKIPITSQWAASVADDNLCIFLAPWII